MDSGSDSDSRESSIPVRPPNPGFRVVAPSSSSDSGEPWDSTTEGASARKRKGVSENDPDWVPYMKARIGSGSIAPTTTIITPHRINPLNYSGQRFGGGGVSPVANDNALLRGVSSPVPARSRNESPCATIENFQVESGNTATGKDNEGLFSVRRSQRLKGKCSPMDRHVGHNVIDEFPLQVDIDTSIPCSSTAIPPDGNITARHDEKLNIETRDSVSRRLDFDGMDDSGHSRILVQFPDFARNDLENKDGNRLRTASSEDGSMKNTRTSPDNIVVEPVGVESASNEKIVSQSGKAGKCKVRRAEKRASLPEGMQIEVPAAGIFSASPATTRMHSGRSKCSGKKHRRRGGCSLVIRRSGKDHSLESAPSQSKTSILSWLLDSGSLVENEKVVYIRKTSSGNLFGGSVTKAGIWCNCCKKVFQPLEFEAHAGSNLSRPWENIFCSSGKSLMQCLRDAWEKEKRERCIPFCWVGTGDPDPNDDTCGVCADGGDLICCDACPSTFHQECLLLKTLPEGSWYCPYCRCRFCSNNFDGQTNPSNLLLCKLCGLKYHHECAWNTERVNTESETFCEQGCKQLNSQLSELQGVVHPINGGFSWTLLKCLNEDQRISYDRKHSHVMESNAKLSLALSVLNECFAPIVDNWTGIEMICQAVYNCGSNFKRLNYEGFYTMILEKDGDIITVASLRFHGTHFAEMPFIGTRPMHRRQGMCRRLLKEIEDLLSSLHIKRLVIPAVSEMLEAWMVSFSFIPLDEPTKYELRNRSAMIFTEITLLQKPIFITEITLLQPSSMLCKARKMNPQN